jgi:hypothetical protein
VGEAGRMLNVLAQSVRREKNWKTALRAKVNKFENFSHFNGAFEKRPSGNNNQRKFLTHMTERDDAKRRRKFHYS